MSFRHWIRIGRFALLALLAVVAAGCGKTGGSLRAASTAPTHAQTVAAGVAICSQTERQMAPLISQLSTIERSHAKQRQRELETGALLEEIAGGNRLDARQLQEVHSVSSDRTAIRALAYRLLELSVTEEQLAQGFRNLDPQRVEILTPLVLSARQATRREAGQLGLQVCGTAAMPPLT